MSPSMYLLLYCLLWLISILVYRFQFRGSGLGLGLLLLWFFSSITAVWMIQQRYYYQSSLYVFDIVSFWPLLYLWGTVLLYSSPILFFKSPADASLQYCSKSNRKEKNCIVNVTIVMFVVLSVAKLSILMRLPNALDFFNADAGSLSKGEHQKEIAEFVFSSQMGVVSNKITNILRDSMLCFAFYFVAVKKYKKAICLFLCCVVLPFYEAIVLGSRQQMICTVITLFITYQLFSPFFDKQMKKRIQRYIGIFVSITIIPTILISLLRFGDYADFLIYELLRYFGESCVNFASWLFPHLEGQDNGRMIMSTLFKDLPFYGSVRTIGPWFYSFIGGLIMAWGRVFTFLGGLLFLYVSVRKVHSLQSRKMSVGKAILLQTIAIMCYEGLFAFIHWLYFGAFVVGFLWIIILDSNWMVLLSRLVTSFFVLRDDFSLTKRS